MQDAAGQDFRLLKFAKTLLTPELKVEARASSRRRTVAATSLEAEEDGIGLLARLGGFEGVERRKCLKINARVS